MTDPLTDVPPPPRLVRRNHSPDRPYAVIEESEPTVDGGTASATTIFLTTSECPIGCHMCDLWQNTLTSATPRGAIARQIDWALERTSRSNWVKLYNSGNFFDARSVPVADYDAIALRCQPFSRVIVENHPAIGRGRVRRFRDRVSGRLEIAVGLETVQPRWLGRLGKRMNRDDFDRYARWLCDEQIDLRVFLIVGVPGIDAAEAIRWARLSVRHAIACRARHVSLIPARSGHGWNGRAASLPKIGLEELAEVQSRAIEDAAGQAVVTVDLWDVERATERTDANHALRLDQLRRINQSQRLDNGRTSRS